MAGVVSYPLFLSRVGTGGIGFTTEGGMYVNFINNTGATSVKGTLVIASTTTDFAVSIAPTSSTVAIGVIYENGIANGSVVKVVVTGRAQVLLQNGSSATHGFWAGTSTTTAGRMVQQATPPTDTDHSREVGHSIQSVTSGTNVLAYIQMHFN